MERSFVPTRSAAGAGLLLRRFLRNEHFSLSVLAAVIGAAAGLGALAFRATIGLVQTVGFGFSSELVITGIRDLPWWQILAVPTVGGLIIGLLLHYLIPDGRYHGVANVIEAVSMNQGRMSLRQGLVSSFAAAASIGVGASTGREGPVVHLGATLAAWSSEKLRLGPDTARTLLGCGAAAAVAASFNAPIAGVLFALEVIIGHHAMKAFAPIVIASVTGTIIGRTQFGAAPAFVVPENVLLSLWEFPAFVLLGIACAITAILFMRSILWAEKLANASPIPPWARSACAGLFVGGIALVLPHVMGVGYEATDIALRAEFALSLILVLIVAKIAATAVCLGFGFAGGVFSPSLYIGALVGGAFGTIAGGIFPDLYSGTTAYALIGTGAVAGAVLGAPLSTILIIFELTGDYTTTVAVMIATVVASVITHQFFGRSFFHVQLKQRGLDLAAAEHRDLLHNMRVSHVMRSDVVTVAPDCPLPQLIQKLCDAPYGAVIVTQASSCLCGILTFADIHRPRDDGKKAPCAGDLIGADSTANPPVVLASEFLDLVQDKMARAEVEYLAVVSDYESMNVLGFVRARDIVQADNAALHRARAQEHGYD